MTNLGAGFAVLDLETTGLRLSSDRVVEIAIVRTDPWGRPLAELCTLLDPERAIGATEIHGITSADVREAPRFRDVAGHILDLLRGAVIVSHNFAFDRGFLLKELDRAALAYSEPVALCTMRLAGEYIDSASGRSLASCCAAAGVSLSHAHHALADARAASALLACCGRGTGSAVHPWARELAAAGRLQWVDAQGRAQLVPRDLAMSKRETRTSYVAKLVNRLPAGASQGVNAESYLAKLDEILEDRIVTEDEGAALEELARDLGIASGDLPRIHFAYLRDLARLAVADLIVTPEERSDLALVASLLGFPAGAVDAALAAAEHDHGESNLAARRPIRAGMLVCFSENQMAKDALSELATAAGLVVRTAVSKKTDLVVSADPLSKSAKLEKGRALGKRILLESLFVTMARELIEPAAPRDPVRPEGEQSAVEPNGPRVPAGWYADPVGRPCYRYWDGDRWTEHVAAPGG